MPPDQSLIGQTPVCLDHNTPGHCQVGSPSPTHGNRLPGPSRPSSMAARSASTSQSVSPRAGAVLASGQQEIRTADLVHLNRFFFGPVHRTIVGASMAEVSSAVRAGVFGALAMGFVGGSVAVSGALADAPLHTAQALRYAVACALLVAWSRATGRALHRPRGTEWLWLRGVAGQWSGRVRTSHWYTGRATPNLPCSRSGWPAYPSRWPRSARCSKAAAQRARVLCAAVVVSAGRCGRRGLRPDGRDRAGVGGHGIRVRGRVHVARCPGPRRTRAGGGLGPRHMDRRGDVRRPRTSHRKRSLRRQALSISGRRVPCDRISRGRGDGGGVHSLVLVCAVDRIRACRAADRRRADGRRRRSVCRSPTWRQDPRCGWAWH